MRHLDRFRAAALHCFFCWAALPCKTSLALVATTLASDADGPRGHALVSDFAEHVRANLHAEARAGVFVEVEADGSVNVPGVDDITTAYSTEASESIRVGRKRMESQDLAEGASAEEVTTRRDTMGLADDRDDDLEGDPATPSQQSEAQLLQAGTFGRTLSCLQYTSFYATKAGGGVVIALTMFFLLMVGGCTMFYFAKKHQNNSKTGEDEPGEGSVSLLSSIPENPEETTKKTMVDFRVSDKVLVLSRDRGWVQGRVAAVQPDGSVDVEYIDNPGKQKLIPPQELATTLRFQETNKTKTVNDVRVGDSVEVLSSDRGWVPARVAKMEADGSIDVEYLNLGKRKLIPRHELAISLRHAQGPADREEFLVGQVVEVLSSKQRWVQARIAKANEDGSTTVEYIGYDLQKTIPAEDLPKQMRSVQSEAKGLVVDEDTAKHILHVLERALRCDASGVLAVNGWFLPVSKLLERQDLRGISELQLRTVAATSEKDNGQRLFDMRDGMYGAEVREHEASVDAELAYLATGVDDDLDWELDRRLGFLGKGALKGHTLTRTGNGSYDMDGGLAHITIEADDGEIFVLRGSQSGSPRKPLAEFLRQLGAAPKFVRPQVLTEQEWMQRRDEQARRLKAGNVRAKE